MAPVPVNSVVDERYDACNGRGIPFRGGVLDLPPLDSPLSRKEQSFLDLATRMAESSDVANRHGAVVVKNGRVLSLGVNKWRNQGYYHNRVVAQDDWQDILTVHAEADALNRVPDANGAVLYIARVGNNGSTAMSRPCWRCMQRIEAAGIKRVVYTVG